MVPISYMSSLRHEKNTSQVEHAPLAWAWEEETHVADMCPKLEPDELSRAIADINP